VTWLILIVRLGRAAPRHRRRAFAEMGDAGAVRVSDGVWAIPGTAVHRAAVAASARRAVAAGRDIVVLPTPAANAPSHDVLEAALSERLNYEAAALSLRCDELAHTASQGLRAGTGAEALREQELINLGRDAQRLSGLDVIGLEAVASVLARVQRAGRNQGINDAA
jgi:hypothetical protein